MEDSVQKEIRRLKEELSRKKEEVRDIQGLVKKEIDREFHLDPEELSERELEAYIREILLGVKKSADTRPDPKALRSHRRTIGRLILFFKRTYMKVIRFYTDLLTAGQTRFNEHSSALFQALVARSRKERERAKQIEEKISRCEENIVLLMAKLKDLQAKLEEQKARASAGASHPIEKE